MGAKCQYARPLVLWWLLTSGSIQEIYTRQAFYYLYYSLVTSLPPSPSFPQLDLHVTSFVSSYRSSFGDVSSSLISTGTSQLRILVHMVSNFHFRLKFHVASFLFTVLGCQRSRFEPWWVQIVSMPCAVLAVQRDSFVGTESAKAVIIFNSAVIYGFYDGRYSRVFLR